MNVLLFEIASALKSTVDSKFPEFDLLKLKQVLSIVQVVMRKDVFAVLPTGSGKQVIFQVISSICSMLAARGCCHLSVGFADQLPHTRTDVKWGSSVCRFYLGSIDRFSFLFVFSEATQWFRGLNMMMIVIETACRMLCILIPKVISGFKFCIYRLFPLTLVVSV